MTPVSSFPYVKIYTQCTYIDNTRHDIQMEYTLYITSQLIIVYQHCDLSLWFSLEHFYTFECLHLCFELSTHNIFLKCVPRIEFYPHSKLILSKLVYDMRPMLGILWPHKWLLLILAKVKLPTCIYATQRFAMVMLESQYRLDELSMYQSLMKWYMYICIWSSCNIKTKLEI